MASFSKIDLIADFRAMNVVALSDSTVVGTDCPAQKRRNASINFSFVRSVTTSKCTARVM